MMGMEYVGVEQVAQLLEVTRQRAQELVARADFPRPAVELGPDPLWDLDAVEVWARGPGRSERSAPVT